MNKREIRAVYTTDTIRIYQAYPNQIADEAIAKGTFGESFKLTRMTWIKPSFLWMMYRCGWAKKENQERVLAIDIKREAFDYLVQNAVRSSYSEEMDLSFEEWQQQVKESEIRIQWDPERDIAGNPLEYRSIQLGIRGEMVRRYVNEWIVKITDITGYVKELEDRRMRGENIEALLPNEKVYSKQDNGTFTTIAEISIFPGGDT